VARTFQRLIALSNRFETAGRVGSLVASNAEQIFSDVGLIRATFVNTMAPIPKS
jgi:hypothetical protein